ncbi:ABC transporter substrate-binding protein [Streptomyces sp. NPDC087420]|uniref:ABC transporter substrate-binding protein n=1 Tax=Streptomyces sp. NPDC087420 TaxID=3365785 RepID=UPI003832D28F
MSTLKARLTRCAAALGLLLTAVACGTGPRNDRLTVMVPWSGAEFQAFYSVIRTFEEDTGIQVDMEVTRAQTQQLDAAVAAGAPPDLAVLPSVGALDRYAQGGRLQPLGDAITEDYAQPFRGLGTVDGQVYAVPVKADVKSLVWYNPAVTREPPPTTLPALRALSREAPKTWCLGLASGPTSGWPGADWIADILLSQSGTDAYRDWLSGDLEWKSPQVSAAWKAWRSIVADSVQDASVRKFTDAAKGMSTEPPTCSLGHGTLSAMGFPSSAAAGTAYDFVTSAPEPARRLEVSADFVGRFTKNPNAAELITYLSSAEAQRTWVNQPGGYGFSADGQVLPAQYRNAAQRRIATMLRPESGYTLCFSAADAMTPDLSAAFYRAVLDYSADKSLLPDLLKGLDEVQADRGESPVPPDGLCAPPS